MYIRIERTTDENGKTNGKRFNFFSREVSMKGNKVSHTDKSVFGNISEAIRTGEQNGKPLYEYDSWSAVFCGKAYEKALTLKDKTRIEVYEFTVRNRRDAETKKSYPSIMITDFDVIEQNASDAGDEGFVEIDPSQLPEFLQDNAQ